MAWKKVVTESSAGNIAQNSATVTTNADLTGDVTSSGNATTYANAVPIAKGGTEQTTTVTGDLLVADGTGSWSRLAIGADNLVLTLDGGEPTWLAATQGDITGITAGVGITGSNLTGPVPTITLDLTELTADTDTLVAADQFIMIDGGVQGKMACSEINLGVFNNDQSWSATTGTVTGATGTAPVSVSNSTTSPVVSMAAATASVDGYLTSTNWSTFNAKAPIADPTFTGNPEAPTPNTSDNTISIATTAYVKAQGYTDNQSASEVVALLNDVATYSLGDASSGTITVNNDLTVTGDLLVSGDTVTVNVGTITVEDKNISVASGATTNALASGAGLTVDTTIVQSAGTKPELQWIDTGTTTQNLTGWNINNDADASHHEIAVMGFSTADATGNGAGVGSFHYDTSGDNLWLRTS